MFTFIGWSSIGVNLLEMSSSLTNYWSFVGMILLYTCIYWYEFAQSITNEAPTCKGKSPCKYYVYIYIYIVYNWPQWDVGCRLLVCSALMLQIAVAFPNPQTRAFPGTELSQKTRSPNKNHRNGVMPVALSSKPSDPNPHKSSLLSTGMAWCR